MTAAPALLLADDTVAPSTYNPGLVSVHVFALYVVPGVRVHDRSGSVVRRVEVGAERVTVDMDGMVAEFPIDGILTLTVEPDYAAEVVAAAI